LADDRLLAKMCDLETIANEGQRSQVADVDARPTLKERTSQERDVALERSKL